MSGYIGVVPLPQATQTRDVFTATSGQTSFATSGYTPNFLDVWLNGVKLVNGDDFTATNGSDVVLTSGAAAGDTVEVLSYSTYEVNAQTYTGGLTVNNDAATVLTVDRATSDGTLVDFKKNGVTVGGVGSYAGDLIIGTGDTYLRFEDANDIISPRNADGTGRDAAVSLGVPSVRFKDLYLSGGVYLGGTGAANLLDDYEEGTFTPTLVSSGTDPVFTYSKQAGKYRKVGNTVLVNIDIRWSAHTQGNGTLYVAGIPFASGNMYSTAAVGEHSAAWGYGSGYTTMSVETANSASIYPLVSGSGRNTSGIAADALAAQSGYIIFSLMYSTD